MTFLASLFAGNAALALAAALTWGGGDFSGGMGVKRAGGTLPAAVRVVLLSHSTSLAFLLIAIALRHDPVPSRTPLLWGLAAGIFGGTSVLCFYVCLARGAMGAPAAISGLLAAAIPSLVSSLLEGAPRPLHLVGFGLAAAAIWLIAASPQPPSGATPGATPEEPSSAPSGATPQEPSSASSRTQPAILALSVAAGAGFGLYFVALRMAGPGGILWPLTLSRCLSITVCLLGLVAFPATADSAGKPRAQAPWLSQTAVRWALATAVLDTAGNLFFIAATRAGRLDVAAVLASLYPASTILLAAWLLRERPARQQALGMSLALAAVILITL